jgi:hypothetical protein
MSTRSLRGALLRRRSISFCSSLRLALGEPDLRPRLAFEPEAHLDLVTVGIEAPVVGLPAGLILVAPTSRNAQTAPCEVLFVVSI